uniref:DUF4283 domain-containing protein n=1 Tax=Lactuca sativa TaxID=4236 RepID=A0A9R1VR15_LACSA|nr:hypothetical protein LSAT_V11C400219930 [Lactuca sativa]
MPAREALSPRAARNSKSYAQSIPSERNNKKRKKKSVELQLQERGIKLKHRKSAADYFSYQPPAIEGASAQVKKFGKDSQMRLIGVEVGGSVEAAPGPLLDFFGVHVKADDVLSRVDIKVLCLDKEKWKPVLFRWMEWNEPLHPCLSPYPLKSTIWVQLKKSQHPSRTNQEMQRAAQMIPCLKNGFGHKNYWSRGSLVFKNYERQDETLLSWNLMFIIFVYIFFVCIALLCKGVP